MKVVNLKDYKRKPVSTFKQCRFLHKYELVESVEVRTRFGDTDIVRLSICKQCGKRKLSSQSLVKPHAGYQVILDKWLRGECHDLQYDSNKGIIIYTYGDYDSEKWRYIKRG